MTVSKPAESPRPATGIPVVWSVPQRNKFFTGREDLLRELRRHIETSELATALLPHALYGLGGVGKSQLAIEYAYRNQSDYEVIWWVPSEDIGLARANLVALGSELGLSFARTEDSVTTVLQALRTGRPYSRWLLVFDNASEPELLRPLMPQGPGHVLVTSRNKLWARTADAVEVDVFPRAESVSFLRRRAPHVATADDELLAEDLGDLPLALEQAGALLQETGMAVHEYRNLLRNQSRKLLAHGATADYPLPVAATWSMSVEHLSGESPSAMELLRRLAFFGPDPIPLDLLRQAEHVVGPSLRDTLGDELLRSRAIYNLGRYSLARLDNHQRTLQVHRLIQQVTRNEIDDPDESRNIRHEVHRMLAIADPGNPDDFTMWPLYRYLLAHATPAGVLECQRDAKVRQHVKNLVRYLFAVGDFSTGLSYADLTLSHWTDLGDDHQDVLVMRRYRGALLWALGRYADAYDLNRETLKRMQASLQEDHEETLILLNTHGADLRARGEFAQARDLDEDSLTRHRRVFGVDHARTFMSGNNLAGDYRILGLYSKALQLQEENYRDRLNTYGQRNHPRVLVALDNVSRARRHVGRHAEARELAERIYRDYQEVIQRGTLTANHPWVLGQAKSLSITRRKTGSIAEALELAREVYDRYTLMEGAGHPDTAAAAITLGNACRAAGELDLAETLIESAVRRCGEALGPTHPYVYCAMINLAIVLRLKGRAGDARTTLERSMAGLEATFGRDQDYVLSCATDLASVLADLGELDQARELGEDTLRRLRATLGEDNPHTLACAANLVLDLRAVGEDDKADRLNVDTLSRYRRTLGADHPDAHRAAQGERIDLDCEPPPL